MSKSALIIGITGQDGSYLAYKLLRKGYKILGTSRNKIININSGLLKLNIIDDIEFYEIEPSNFEEILI